MFRNATLSVTAFAAVLSAPIYAQELVGPTDEWYGIDNLSITYSGGTQLFNVHFDRRSYNDVFGSKTPDDLPFSTDADVGAALTAIADFFNSESIQQHDLRPIVRIPGGSDVVDHILIPRTLTPTHVTRMANVDDGGPTQWQFNPQFDFWEDTSILLTQDWVDQGGHDYAWAVFTPVPEPSSLALLGLGGLLIARRRRG